MKKYIVLCLLLVAPFFAKADTTVYGFLDNKFYDVSQKLVYFCFQDGSCYDMNNNPVQITINHPADIVASTTPVVIPLDVCANIEGTQTVIPVGMVNQGGNCVVPVSQPVAGGATQVQPPSVVAEQIITPSCTLTAINMDPFNDYNVAISWTTTGIDPSVVGRLFPAMKYVSGIPDYAFGNRGGSPILTGVSGTYKGIGRFENYKADFGTATCEAVLQ